MKKVRTGKDSVELLDHLQKMKKEFGMKNQPVSGFEKFLLREALFGTEEEKIVNEMDRLKKKLKILQQRLKEIRRKN